MGGVKRGGVLIYSTCTYNAYENEDNVKWLLDSYDAEMLPVTIDAEWALVKHRSVTIFIRIKPKVKDFMAPCVNCRQLRKLNSKTSTQQNSGRNHRWNVYKIVRLSTVIPP